MPTTEWLNKYESIKEKLTCKTDLDAHFTEPCHNHQANAHCDTERHKQRIQHAYGSCNIILVSDIPDRRRKRNPRHKRNNGTDDHLSQMVSDSTLIQQNAKQRNQRSSGKIGGNL